MPFWKSLQYLRRRCNMLSCFYVFGPRVFCERGTLLSSFFESFNAEESLSKSCGFICSLLAAVGQTEIYSTPCIVGISLPLRFVTMKELTGKRSEREKHE